MFLKPSEAESGSIHLGFYTTRDVKVGEELVSQYGEDYWKTVNKQVRSHSRCIHTLFGRPGRRFDLHLRPFPPPLAGCDPAADSESIVVLVVLFVFDLPVIS